jgi:hypothetical protein
LKTGAAVTLNAKHVVLISTHAHGAEIMQLSIQPMQWSVLPELQDAPPLDNDDLACLMSVMRSPGTAS